MRRTRPPRARGRCPTCGRLIAQAESPKQASLYKARGLWRANPDAPEDQQIREFIASAPWQWLPDEQINDPRGAAPGPRGRE